MQKSFVLQQFARTQLSNNWNWIQW